MWLLPPQVNRTEYGAPLKRAWCLGSTDLPSGLLIGAFSGVWQGLRGLVVPRHPGAGVGCELVGMALERDQVFERGDLVSFGGVDQAHEAIADKLSPPSGPWPSSLVAFIRYVPYGVG